MIANSRTKADARAASGASAGYLMAVPAPSTASRAGLGAGGTADSSPVTRGARCLAARTPSSETARTWDGEQPWLGHGPGILSATMRDIRAVLDRVSDLCGPEGNPRALPIVDFPSADAALTAASQRVTEALWEDRQDAPLARGSAETVGLLLELKETQGRLREARLAQRIAASASVQDALGRLHGITSVSQLIDRVPEEACRLGFDRAMISRLHGSMWVPEAVYVEGDAGWAREILRVGRDEPQLLTHLILETEMVRRRGPLLVPDAQTDPRVHPTLAAATQSRSYVTAPIMPEGRVIGFLHADCYMRRRHVDEFCRDVLWMFAQGVGYAFQHTVLSERLHALRATLGRMTFDITKVTDELVDAEVEVARTDPENAAVARSGAAMFVADHSVANSELTRREIDVLRLMATGETNAGIAARLIISEGTVKSHVKHILRKLRAANRAEAVCRYLRMESGNATGRSQMSNGPAVPRQRWLWESPQKLGCEEVRTWWLPSPGVTPPHHPQPSGRRAPLARGSSTCTPMPSRRRCRISQS
jgi:LuxR family transcriptional regulator, regulator of acetate metabolism